MKFFFLFLFFLVTLFSSAQDKKNDLAFISTHASGMMKVQDVLNTKTPMRSHHKNFIARYNPVTLSLTGLMLFYQHLVSPQLSSACVYTRSCSNFSKEAIAEFGIIKGVFLTADRLMRCNRPCENDFPASAITVDGKITDEPGMYKRN